MHDPYTLVADLRFVQIWHRDKGGHDGACGWSFPHLSKQQALACKSLGHSESRENHYLRYPTQSHVEDVADREALYRALLLTVARVIRVPLKYEDAAKEAAEKSGLGGFDGLDRIFCFVPGYHTNFKQDRPEHREEYWGRTCHGIARGLLLRNRKWWQHPRWHIWHWRIHVPVFRRWFGWSGIDD